MNVASLSQSLILAGESPEVEVLVRRAMPVTAGIGNASGSASRDVALQFTTVAHDADYASPSRGIFANPQPRSPLDLYRRVQRTNAPKVMQIVDVFA